MWRGSWKKRENKAYIRHVNPYGTYFTLRQNIQWAGQASARSAVAQVEENAGEDMPGIA